MAKIGTDIDYAASLLKQGKIIAIPTETVYGLAGNALDHDVVKDIYEVKNRPFTLPMIAQVNRIRKVKELIKNVPVAAKILAQKYWPGALTLVLERADVVPDILVNGGDTVGVRISDHMMTLELLYKLDFPVAVPSANIHGEKSPTTAEEVNEQLGDKIEYILDGGKCSVGLESTIVGFNGEEPIIFREGAISKEEILEAIDNEETD
ncbi:MAG: threonylcarbamoyl-AMP synthase [Cyclobacteriaceae bacterium]